MIRVHALSLTHAKEIGLNQGWRETQWEVYTLQAVRGLSEPVVVTCGCVPIDPGWREYLLSSRTILVTIVCPRCEGERYAEIATRAPDS
jgi:hypothetical protein